MPGGRPPKPSNLRRLQGNPGKRPLPAREPTPPAGEIKPPSWLKGKGRAAWRRLLPLLESMRVMTPADCEALALGCDALGEYVELRDIIRRGGRTYQTTTQSGAIMYRTRPEVALAADAWRKADHILSAFGLTPSARSKVQTVAEIQRDPFEEFLGRKNG